MDEKTYKVCVVNNKENEEALEKQPELYMAFVCWEKDMIIRIMKVLKNAKCN